MISFYLIECFVLFSLYQTDCTLPEDSPYRQACGLRPGSTASLVSLNFASHPPSHTDPRIPPGFSFYTLQAKLSELQLVFLYRFLQENLQYISIMLAMRPPVQQAQQSGTASPRALTGAGSSSPSPRGPISPRKELNRQESQSQSQSQQAQQAQQQPFVLAMDIEMDAPVISMPRSSNSSDAIDVDLGLLTLKTRVEGSHINGSTTIALASLVEVAELTFSGVDCRVVQSGRRGHSVVKNPEQGWKVGWRRSLMAMQRGDMPFVSYYLYGNGFL